MQRFRLQQMSSWAGWELGTLVPVIVYSGVSVALPACHCLLGSQQNHNHRIQLHHINSGIQPRQLFADAADMEFCVTIVVVVVGCRWLEPR
jgi:hypothetical protein